MIDLQRRVEGVDGFHCGMMGFLRGRSRCAFICRGRVSGRKGDDGVVVVVVPSLEVEPRSRRLMAGGLS